MNETIDDLDRYEFLYLDERITRLVAEVKTLDARRAAAQARIIEKYKIGPADQLDITTGAIVRAPATKE